MVNGAEIVHVKYLLSANVERAEKRHEDYAVKRTNDAMRPNRTDIYTKDSIGVISQQAYLRRC